MSGFSLDCEGIVLSRELRGEGQLFLQILSGQGEILPVLQRQSRRSSRSVDLFDQASLILQRPSAEGPCFLKDFRLLRRHSGIGQSYEALAEASRWCRFLQANLRHGEHGAQVFLLSLRALDAWERKTPPRAVRFKSLFVLAREEGYPVQEDWLRSLEPGLRGPALDLLRLPAEEAWKLDPEPAERLSLALARWLSDTADFSLTGSYG